MPEKTNLSLVHLGEWRNVELGVRIGVDPVLSARVVGAWTPPDVVRPNQAFLTTAITADDLHRFAIRTIRHDLEDRHLWIWRVRFGNVTAPPTIAQLATQEIAETLWVAFYRSRNPGSRLVSSLRHLPGTGGAKRLQCAVCDWESGSFSGSRLLSSAVPEQAADHRALHFRHGQPGEADQTLNADMLATAIAIVAALRKHS